ELSALLDLFGQERHRIVPMLPGSEIPLAAGPDQIAMPTVTDEGLRRRTGEAELFPPFVRLGADHGVQMGRIAAVPTVTAPLGFAQRLDHPALLVDHHQLEIGAGEEALEDAQTRDEVGRLDSAHSGR